MTMLMSKRKSKIAVYATLPLQKMTLVLCKPTLGSMKPPIKACQYRFELPANVSAFEPHRVDPSQISSGSMLPSLAVKVSATTISRTIASLLSVTVAAAKVSFRDTAPATWFDNSAVPQQTAETPIIVRRFSLTLLPIRSMQIISLRNQFGYLSQYRQRD